MTTQAVKKPTAGLSTATGEMLDDITRIFTEAVAEVRAENRRLGIPNVQTDEQGRLTEELPDGTVRVIEHVAEYRIPSQPDKK
jgi:hypothetical protein